MSNPPDVMVFETAKSLLEAILCCLGVALVLSFFPAVTTANVNAIYYCFVSLVLTLFFGGTYMHLILAANNSPWAIAFDVVNLLYLTGSVVHDMRSIFKACKRVLVGEKLKSMPSEELLLKKEAQLKEQEKTLTKWEDILSKREEVFSKREDNLSKWENTLTKQEEELKKQEERVTKA